MDERMRFVARFLEGEKMAGLCREFDISRKTGYKIFERYQACGLQGLTDRSRRPQHHPWQLPYAVQQAIVRLRGSRRMQLGPKKIQARLREMYPDQPVPSLTTIYNTLKRAGAITPRRRRDPIERQ